MQLHKYALAAVLSLTVPETLAAQSQGSAGGAQSGQGGSTSGRTDTSVRSAQGDPQGGNQGNTTSTSDSGSDRTASRWVASGFVGSNYKNNSGTLSGGIGSTSDDTNSSVDFGASIGYLWHNIAGAEFVANFTPNFEMQNTLLPIGSEPNVNSYMFNAIGAVPLGADGQWQPFVSGGFGAITLRSSLSDTSSNDAASAVTDTFNPDETRAGANIGAGVMGFLGSWGVRADVRYFRAFSADTTTASTDGATDESSLLLSGLNFWRANIGVAFRW